MSPAAALLTGLTMAFGLVLLGSGAPGRRAPRLLTRLDPYLRGLEPRSTQLLETEEAPLVPVPMLDRLLRPILDEGGELVERCLGGAAGVARRLREAGLAENVARFRAEQMLWGLAGFTGCTASAVGSSGWYSLISVPERRSSPHLNVWPLGCRSRRWSDSWTAWWWQWSAARPWRTCCERRRPTYASSTNA